MRQRNVHPNNHLHVVVDKNLCFYCGACVAVCPPDSIFLENAHLRIDDETCTRCERCTAMCPVHALSMVEIERHEAHV
jgi:ferredoxin